MLREREQEPRCWTIQSQTERRDRGQTGKSWLLFEGVDTFLYDLMRKSKIEKVKAKVYEQPLKILKCDELTNIVDEVPIFSSRQRSVPEGFLR